MVSKHGVVGEVVLSARGIKKSFSRVEVLHGVDFELRSGEVHGIVGQNGAGKSTLMKIINGVYNKDEGTITIYGEMVNFDSPIAARQHGIAMVYQEFSLVPSMTVVQNLFLAQELKNGLFIDEEACRARAQEVFEELDVDIDPDMELSKLPVGTRQVVEIGKALSQDASILIMDEPTASLSSVEIEMLFDVVRRLKKEGIAIIFVSHHLNEVIEICDQVTVIRDGKVALSAAISELSLQDIITAMIGKKLDVVHGRSFSEIDRAQPLLEARHLSAGSYFKDISFSLYPGEVLGIAGVLGSGRTELLKTLYGIMPRDKGEVLLLGRPVYMGHPEEAIRSGVIMVPEDRRKNGLIAGQSVSDNVLLPIWKRLSSLFFIQDQQGEEIVHKFVDDLQIRANSIEQTVAQLSGGNQQKVVFAKSLAAEPKILLLDDPTVGVDIATKKDIAQIVRRIASQGNGVIYVSSEMEEIAELCDRVLILRRGELIQEFVQREGDFITEGALMSAIQR
jgi:ribose transport system ATP-binding protein